jgi:hypothetical protein
VREALSYLEELDPESRAIVRGSYGEALQTTFWFCVASAACAAVSSLFIKEKRLTRKPS